jgi:hypothetical protein
VAWEVSVFLDLFVLHVVMIFLLFFDISAT